MRLLRLHGTDLSPNRQSIDSVGMSAIHRPLLWALLVALVFLQCQSVLANDPCQLLPQNRTVWYGLPSKVRQCFAAIPFAESVRQRTMTIMERVFQLYSFSDIVQADLEPFHLKVRIFRRRKFPFIDAC